MNQVKHKEYTDQLKKILTLIDEPEAVQGTDVGIWCDDAIAVVGWLMKDETDGFITEKQT